MSIEQRGKNIWRVTISNGYDQRGRQVRYTNTIHGSYKDATTAEKLLAAEVAKKRQAKESPKKMSLHDFFAYWLENYARPHLAEKTIALYIYEFRRIDTALGSKPIDKIEPRHLLMFYDNLRKCPRLDQRGGHLSATSIRKYHTLLHLLFKRAVRWQMIFSNPVDKVDPPAYKYQNEKTILDKEQAGRFLLLLKDEPLKHQAWSILAIALGLRRGEIFALQWKHIDFASKTILIEQSSKAKEGGGVVIGPTKSRRARLLSAPDSLMQLLEAYRAEYTVLREETANKWEGASELAENFLFTTWNGLPGCPDAMNTWLRRFVKAHDLPKISPHSFRHMAATYLITAGVDLRTVAGKLGHANSTTTQLVYSHLLRQAEYETADVMNGILQDSLKYAEQKQCGHDGKHQN